MPNLRLRGGMKSKKNGIDDQLRIHARVSGRVQGVGFRYFVKEHAERLNLTGWVKNRPDGDVELEVQGTKKDVRLMLVALNQGPSMAFVLGLIEHHTDVVTWEENFRIRR